MCRSAIARGQGCCCSPSGAPEVRARWRPWCSKRLAGCPARAPQLRLAGSASGARRGQPCSWPPLTPARTASNCCWTLRPPGPSGKQLLTRRCPPLRPWRRDTLRPEAAMHLYGQDWDRHTPPWKPRWAACSPGDAG